MSLARAGAKVRTQAHAPLLEVSDLEIVFSPDGDVHPRRVQCDDVIRVHWEAENRVVMYRKSGGYFVLNLVEIVPSDLPLVRDELRRILRGVEHVG